MRGRQELKHLRENQLSKLELCHMAEDRPMKAETDSDNDCKLARSTPTMLRLARFPTVVCIVDGRHKAIFATSSAHDCVRSGCTSARVHETAPTCRTAPCKPQHIRRCVHDDFSVATAAPRVAMVFPTTSGGPIGSRHRT